MAKVWITIIVLALNILGVYAARERIIRQFFRPRAPTPSDTTSNPDSVVDENSGEIRKETEVVADDLSIPWEVVFLPDGDLLVTQRPGKLVRIDGETESMIDVAGVRHIGEGGLLGVALHPDYANNNFIYLYLTTQVESGLENRVERYEFINDTITNREVIIDGIKGASNHDGGRIEFGPDDKLYVTTGDAEVPSLAQDTNSLNGKILRINDDGSIPLDNPFGNSVWSYGHRNPQGLAWDSQGRLWASEHGPSGAQTGNDEINLIGKGANYGWPEIRGTQSRDGMRSPLIESGRSDTWAPGDVEIVGDTLFFTGLRGETLYSADISGDTLINLTRDFTSRFGRLRALRLGPEGYLYSSTSNTDGRGNEKANDDRIIRIDPDML